MIAVAFVAAAGGYLLRDSQDVSSAWSRCVDAAAGIDVEYPANWHRGETDDPALACRFFDPEPFEVPAASDFGGTALEAHTLEATFEDALASLIDTRFAETRLREQATVDAGPAFRLELVATGEGLDDRGTQIYAYLVDRERGGPVLVQTTARPGEALVYRGVVDRAASTLRLAAPASAAGTGLPEPVEQKRAAILAAAEANDHDAVAALADEEFSYTFGQGVEGGPAAFWRQEAARANDPLAALRTILALPYTLAGGHYVWPFAYDRTADTLTEYERGLLAPLGTTFAGEGYLGWRAGITPDGRWVFFVAGD